MKRIIALVATTALVGVASAQTKIVIDGSTTVGPIAKAFAEYTMAAHPEVNISVSESGSGNGAKGLLNGTCDIADMSRSMKDTEFKACADKGIQPVAHVVALDGLPILVHPSNPVKDLTVEQVRKIYLGEITNWKEVGGPDQKIVTISRDTSSGTYETFEEKVMEKGKIREDCEYVGSNGAIRSRVQTTPAAIGYAGLGFVDKTVKALKVNGISPSAETVQSGQYPIARPLFMYTNGYPALGSPLYQFVTIHLSEDGQEMVEDIGFVPVTAY
ncbi:MAG: phosphate ABC transporter substrate-binding protein PstS [Lentisphaerae bacterium]|jgi:phosphate transport system substrate-binding protein|nr:phosphate ABC transporter substrate-binding protein PstS [Lentisphaerota bacterium]